MPLNVSVLYQNTQHFVDTLHPTWQSVYGIDYLMNKLTVHYLKTKHS